MDPEQAKSAHQSIIVERPLAEVFTFGCDLAKRCQWQRDTLSGCLIDPEIAELGARCTETRRAPGGTVEQWDLEIVAFERDGLVAIHAECDRARVVERHVFSADPSSAGRTRYTLTLEASGARWTAGELRRQIVDHLIHFRDCVESPDTAVTGARWSAPRLRRKADAADASGTGLYEEGGPAIGRQR